MRPRLQRRLRDKETDSQAFFAGAAGQWDKLRGQLYGQGFTRAAVAALLPAGWTVADLGCGTGSVSAEIAPYVRQVIGVDTAATDSYKMSGVQGFAIPIGRAMGVAGQIRSGAGSNTVHIGPTGFLGLGVMDNNGSGARVQRVVSNGPAGAAGIAPGDVITGVDNVAITGATSMTEVLVPHHPGDNIAVHYRSNNGGDHTVNITLAEGPPA